MTKMIGKLIFVLGLLGSGHQVLAVPVLQLDIGGGYYVAGSEESIITSDEAFTVYAYATANGNTTDSQLLADTYYLAIALAPKQTSAGDFGSFSVNGTTVNATADMIFGKPPTSAAHHLGAHDVYDTYYYEIAFNLVASQTSDIYNTQDNAGSGPIGSGPGMFYVDFDIDKTNLADGIELHFDLYNTKVKNNGTVTVDDFAPFSHDAGTVTVVPEPSNLAVGALGLLALLVGKRKGRGRDQVSF